MENPEVSDRETFSLNIKTPNQFHGDQVIEGVRMDWTVKDLKCHLSKVYPSNPVRLGLLFLPRLVYVYQTVRIPQHDTESATWLQEFTSCHKRTVNTVFLFRVYSQMRFSV